MRQKGLETPEKRKEFASRIVRMIEAAENQRGQLPERWHRLESMYRGTPIATGTEINGVVRNMNIVKPRLKQVVANVCNPLFSIEPYFAARGYGAQGEMAKRAEKNVHFFNQRAQLDRRVKKAVLMAAKADPAIIKVHFEDGLNMTRSQTSDTVGPDGDVYVGPTYTVIHPKNFAIYPLYLGNIQEAVFVGHKYAKRSQDILEGQKSKLYYNEVDSFSSDDVQEGDGARDQEWSRTEETMSIQWPEDEPVEVWEGIIKADLDDTGFEQRYLVQVARTQQFLLWCQPYGVEIVEQVPTLDPDTMEQGVEETKKAFIPYSRPWYFEISLTEPEGDEFYRANPIAHDLQENQLSFNELWGQFFDGSMMAACPAGFTSSPMLQQQQLKYQPGTVYTVDDPTGIVWVAPAFDGKNHPYMMDLIMKMADAALSMSQAGQGQESSGDTTATEYSGILAGQRTGMDDLRTIACTFLSPMMDFVRELISLNWDSVMEMYAEELPHPDQECMKYGYTWEPMVKSGMNTPQEVTLKLQGLLQFLGSVGITPTPEVIAELVNVYTTVLDLPTDMEKLKDAIVMAFTQTQQMQQDSAGQDEAFQQGLTDGLTNGSRGNANAGQPGMGALSAMAPRG